MGLAVALVVNAVRSRGSDDDYEGEEDDLYDQRVSVLRLQVLTVGAE